MSALHGFANIHPFFVHAPLVLIPTAAAMVWVGRAVRKDGFDTATLLITIAAALGALAAMTSGYLTDGTFVADEATRVLLNQHQINGTVLAIVSSLAALMAVAERRGLVGRRAWWLRAAILLWATVGVVFNGHNGAQLVYQHGVAVSATR
jgi:uncharacterized membrane protein